MSPLRSSAGPAVWTNGTPSSSATIRARLVLPRPGGPASRTWSSASPRAAAAAIETPSCSRSSSWPTNSSSRWGRSVASSSSSARSCGVCSAVDARRADAHRRAPFSAWAIRSSGVSPGAPSSSCSASAGAEAEPDEAVAGQQPRVVAAGDHDRVVGRRRADLLAQLDDDPLGRALADAGHRLQPRGVAGGDRGEQLARRAAGEHGERDLRPDGLDPDQHQEQVALGLGGEAVQRERVVADDQVGVQRGLLADRRGVAERLAGDGEPVADAAARDDDVVGPPHGDLAGEQRDHAAAPTAARSDAPFAWQIATASASAAWSGRGRSVSDSSAWTMRWTWPLSARPEPHTAPLICCGV